MIDRDAIQKARQDREFTQNGWLTFYLVGAPDRHAKMAAGLQELEAVNLSDGVGGFVYAKVPVSIEEAAIEQQISKVRLLAEKTGVEIDLIDLDSGSDVEKSRFYTLWKPC